MNGNTMKKKLTSLLLVAAMVLTTLGVTTIGNVAYAAENEITVYVTISDKGELAVDASGNTMAYVPVKVPADANGLATVDAVMVAFHEVYCPGGYVTEDGAWGLTVSKLWNVENNYGYSFAINNAPLSLGVGQDTVGEGGYVYGYIMKDITAWTDVFAYGTADKTIVKTGEAVSVAFSSIGYDPVTWEQVSLPLSNVAVKAVGAETALGTTDVDGKVAVSFDAAGTYIVYAENPAGAATTFSAPACVITVEAEEDESMMENEDDTVTNGGEGEAEDKNAAEEPAAEEESADEAEKAPATSDNAQLAVYMLMLMAAAGAAFVLKKQK